MSNIKHNDHMEIDFHTVLASSVHDIKNSLSLLMGALDQLTHSKQFETNEEKNQLRILQSEARNINSSLIHVLGLYRLQQDKLPLTIEEVFVHDMLDEVIATHENLLQLQSINIEIDCAIDLAWYFDIQLISSIINNIIVNAAKHAKANISLKAWIENNELKIQIEDDGIGFPEHILSNQNAPSSSINFQTGSTSLGLFFAEQIAHTHEKNGIHGNISLSNRREGGGRFLLTLP